MSDGEHQSVADMVGRIKAMADMLLDGNDDPVFRDGCGVVVDILDGHIARMTARNEANKRGHVENEQLLRAAKADQLMIETHGAGSDEMTAAILEVEAKIRASESRALATEAELLRMRDAVDTMRAALAATER